MTDDWYADLVALADEIDATLDRVDAGHARCQALLGKIDEKLEGLLAGPLGEAA